MLKTRLFFCLFCSLCSSLLFAQKKSTQVSGRILDENENPLPGTSIVILGRNGGVNSSDSGTFTLKAPAEKAFALVFSHAGYKTEQRNFYLNEGESETITIRMEPGARELKEVVVTDQRPRREAGLVTINPKQAINIPTPTGGIESMIKVFVGSNNELTSNYSVRGGSYDENLIYVNDFEVFRPYLVRSGQQEGLSFINPELTKSVSFYNGGFPAKYGDKMSSVLDIQYKKPKQFGGSAYISLLEQGLHLEGTGFKNKFSYLVGVRNKTNRNLLASQEVKGNYVPSSYDMQGLLSYQFDKRWNASIMANLSQTKFNLIPYFSQQTASVFSPYFTANLGLDVYFQGQEEDRYRTNMVGVTVTGQVRKDLSLKWRASYFRDNEKESLDISGAYLFGERNFDKSQSTFGLIVNPLGAGIFQNHARNTLNIDVWNLSHKGYYDKGKHAIQWGVSADHQVVHDKIDEWQYQDSAGYSLPYNSSNLSLYNVLKSKADLEINRLSGYIQDNIAFRDSSDFILQAGVRFNYNDLNHEFLVTPRIGFSWKPSSWKSDIIFRGSLGLYDQPPFYRELRRYDGTINTNLKAQKSWQVSGGFDYSFVGLNGRPMRFTTEAYYKGMHDVVPYDVDNVRLRYYGENSAKAYAAGVEFRLFGELVKDAESWLSIGIMKTKEKIDGATYYNYTLDSASQRVDSTLVQQGWVRRPTDRLITIGLYLQDYLATNKNFKVYLNTIYGSNMPYNIPGSVKYRNALILDPYLRIDIGFSALLLDSDRSKRGSHSPFRNFENIWATLEVFNLIDRANTISYLFIKDFSNTVYSVPNRLTPRLLNLKLVARF